MASIVYFIICFLLYDENYWKFFKRTFVVPGIFIATLGMGLNIHFYLIEKEISVIFWGIFGIFLVLFLWYVEHILYYFIIKFIKKRQKKSC